MAKYLDPTGLTYLWGKIKSIFMQKGVDYVTAGKKDGTILGDKATAEGNNTTASGSYSHAEGYSTKASGNYSHSEGYGGIALGQNSHIEGRTTIATELGAHAEGDSGTFVYIIVLTGDANATTYTVVSATVPTSHINSNGVWRLPNRSFILDKKIIAATYGEGPTLNTITLEETLSDSPVNNKTYSIRIANASNTGAHSEGIGTVAFDSGQHAGGKYNIPVNGAEVIGGGTSSNPANIRTLDWSGNEVLAGKLTVGAAPTNDMDVATKYYVDNATPPPEIFWITASVSGSTITANKTFTEISTAISEGKYPLIMADNNRVFQFLYIYAGNYIRFTRLVGTTAEGWKCNSNNTWEIDYNGTIDNSTLVPAKGTDPTSQGIVYTDLASAYVGGTSHAYWKITFPSAIATMWTMLYIEVSLRQRYSVSGLSGGEGGKLLINAYHNASSPYSWSINATILGQLNSSTTVYGSDGTTFWISGAQNYDDISIDRVLVGDAARGQTLIGATVETATALPSTYQTATMFTYQKTITTSGILKGDGSGGVTAAVAGTDYQAPISNNITGSGTNGYATVFNGTNTVTSRAITNNTATSSTISASTNLITANTLRYHTNRTTSVATADTNYTTVMARGISLTTSAGSPANGAIVGVYIA